MGKRTINNNRLAVASQFFRRIVGGTQKQTRWEDITISDNWTSPDINDETIWQGTNEWGMEPRCIDSTQAQVARLRSWVYICVNYRARAIARQTLRLYKSKTGAVPGLRGSEFPVTMKQKSYLANRGHISESLVTKSADVTEIEDHEFLRMMRSVNPLLNQADLWMLTETFMGLTGNCYWWPRVNALGVPYQLWVWESQKMKVVLGRSLDEYIKGYVYEVGIQHIPFEADAIVHHKYPNPLSLAVGRSPVAALSDAIMSYENMNAYERAQFKNMARPDGVIEVEEALHDDSFERLKTDWKETYGGVSKSGQVAVLEGGAKYHQISLSPRDLEFLAGRKLTREEIADGYGIPMPLLSPENSNKANSIIAYAQFMRDTVDSLLKLYEQKINEQLLPMFPGGENMFVAFDNCVPDDRDMLLKERERGIRGGWLAWDEVRSEDGREEYPDELGKLPWISKNMIQIGTPPPPEPAPKPPKEEPEEPEEGEEEGEIEEAANNIVQAILRRAERK